jgi:hypothetical protein
VVDNTVEVLRLLQPTFNRSRGTDGFISLEVAPELARNTVAPSQRQRAKVFGPEVASQEDGAGWLGPPVVDGPRAGRGAAGQLRCPPWPAISDAHRGLIDTTAAALPSARASSHPSAS